MTYAVKMRWLLLLAYGGAAAVGLVAGRIVDFAGEGLWWRFPLFLALGSLVFVAGAPYWNRLDDVQKQGQLNAWYWGAMAGTVAFVMWLAANNLQHSDFGRGAGVMVLIQFGGYVVAYVVWRLRGRGVAE